MTSPTSQIGPRWSLVRTRPSGGRTCAGTHARARTRSLRTPPGSHRHGQAPGLRSTARSSAERRPTSSGTPAKIAIRGTLSPAVPVAQVIPSPRTRITPVAMNQKPTNGSGRGWSGPQPSTRHHV